MHRDNGDLQSLGAFIDLPGCTDGDLSMRISCACMSSKDWLAVPKNMLKQTNCAPDLFPCSTNPPKNRIAYIVLLALLGNHIPVVLLFGECIFIIEYASKTG